MKLQSLPDGQQSAAACAPVLFRAKHFVLVGQQKFKGSPWPHCVKFDSPPHRAVSRATRRFEVSGSRSVVGSAPLTAAAKTEVAGMVAASQYRSVKSRTREECMLDDVDTQLGECVNATWISTIDEVYERNQMQG
jgi:hypothetical protein